MNIETPSLFTNCVLWWPGSLETSDGFPIKPSGVTATPNGTWSNPLDLGNNKSVKTFDGSTNYVSLTANSAWELGTGDFSLLCWINPTTAVDTSDDGIIGTSQSYEVALSLVYGWKLTRSFVGDKVGFVIGGAQNSGTGLAIVSTTAYTAGTWQCIAVIRSGTSLKIYKNLTEIYSGTTSLSLNSNTNVLNLGSFGTDANRYYKGNLKDGLLYKGRAITLAELTTIMRLTDPRAASMGEGISPGGFDYWRIS